MLMTCFSILLFYLARRTPCYSNPRLCPGMAGATKPQYDCYEVGGGGGLSAIPGYFTGYVNKSSTGSSGGLYNNKLQFS